MIYLKSLLEVLKMTAALKSRGKWFRAAVHRTSSESYRREDDRRQKATKKTKNVGRFVTSRCDIGSTTIRYGLYSGCTEWTRSCSH